MPDDRHYDVIVIGTGAGGGTLAHRLAPTGKQVLLLERGDYLPRERDNWDSTAVFVQGKYRAPEFWSTSDGDEFPPEVNYYVGGNTKFYGAALFRLRPQDFGEIRHHGGISPAWPIDYEDLEPYYTQAEHLYLVHGRHGEDPTEGHASAQYRSPAGAARATHPAAERRPGEAGPAPVPPADRGQPDPGRARAARPTTSACIRCDRVDGFPCLVGAKSDAQVICVDPALEHDNVELVTNAHVRSTGDRRDRPHGHRGRGRARRRLDGTLHRRHRRRRVRRGELRRRCCCARPTTGTRTGWPTARTSSAGTTCGTTTWR